MARRPRVETIGDARVCAAISTEEYRGLRLATGVRLLALSVIAVWVGIENAQPEALFYWAMIAAFATMAVAQMALSRPRRAAAWPRYVFPMLEAALFTATALASNPFSPKEALPPQVRLRLGNDLYLYVLLSAALFTYSPRVVVWTGACLAVAWSAGTLWVLLQPDSFVILERYDWQRLAPHELLAHFLDPRFVNISLLGRQVLLLVLVAGVMAAVVQRSRRLVLRQVAAERERANLSRYFSPNVVDELARSDKPLRTTRQQAAGVLFVDIVGFSGFAATASPEAVIALLRDFHRRVAQAVFAHRGTLNKFLGDGIMATFGAPRVGSSDAADTVACVRSLANTVAAWNAERAGRNEPPLGVGIGAHFGPVILGDIGDDRHLEFAVVGDTVNIASRLQELTRAAGVQSLLSTELVEAARGQGANFDGVLSPEEVAPREIRGRAGVVGLWTLRPAEANSPDPNK